MSYEWPQFTQPQYMAYAWFGGNAGDLTEAAIEVKNSSRV